MFVTPLNEDTPSDKLTQAGERSRTDAGLRSHTFELGQRLKLNT